MEFGLTTFGGALGVALVGLGAVGVAITLLSDWAVGRWLRAERRRVHEPDVSPSWRPPSECSLPPISVLRPVKGLDVGLLENFEALVAQGYPEFEILVGAENPNDPALDVARRVAKSAAVPVRIVICPNQTGLNPKVSILEALAREAKYDALLISDSNVRVRPGYLKNLGERLNEPKVGLVTNIVLGETPGTLAAVLEMLQLVTFVARATLFARHFVGHACVVGKSMLFRSSDWSRLGGFAQVRNVLAEDYVMGHAFARAGFRVELAPDPAPVPLPRWGYEQLLNRHLRWAQMRRRISPGAFTLEPLLYPAPLLGLGLALGCWSRVDGLPTVALVCLMLRFACDAWLLRALNGGRAAWWWCLLAPVKDCLALGVWAVGGVKRTLMWRGNRLVIHEGSRLEREPTDVDLAISLG